MVAANKNILENLRDGSKESLEAFFRAYYQDLFLWAFSIVRDAEAAEDCVQEFFLDFLQKKRYEDVKGNMQSYIFRSVKNYCMNYLKRDKKLVRDLPSLEHEKSEAPVEIKDSADEHQKIYSTINLLPEKCKEIFMYCCVYDYTYNETAEELGVSINTVRTQITRAFKFLRERLKSSDFIYFFSVFRKNAKRY